MNATLHRQSDGMGAIHYDAQAQTLCLTNDNDSTRAKDFIGPLNLRELAAKLLALAEIVEGKKMIFSLLYIAARLRAWRSKV